MAGVTYRDVAEELGISTASVSRALAGAPGISPELSARVREVAAELGYRSNRAAKALRRQRADAIGLVISDVENPFFASVARAVEGVAAERDHAVLLCNTDEDLDKERLYLDLMIGESVAGVIVAPSTEEIGALEHLVKAGIPTVTLDRVISGNPFDSVLSDNLGAAHDLVEHLIEHGHTRIGAVLGTTAATPSRERLEGCRSAVIGHPRVRLSVREGAMKDAIGVADTFALGERAALELLKGRWRPTAIFCANGLLSLGVLRAVKKLEMRVPEDVALVGFDDQPFFDLLDPPLTVAAQRTDVLGRRAAEMLFDRIAQPDGEVRSVTEAADLRFRRSCGCTT